MQEIHSIGSGKIFSGGGGGDRRLRAHHQNHQALKCPRCDSQNTKFCYYNNYNLSQPRHFCKNCRRYWTKGGVLRNVPVGGGCRKSKRSSKAAKNSTSSSETAAAAASTSKLADPELKSNSHSSSESSSLTAATAAAITTEAISAPTANSASNNKINMGNTHDSKLFVNHRQSLNPGFELEQGVGGGDGGVFSEIGSLMSLITSTNEALAFGFGNSILDATSFRFNAQHGSDPLSAVPGGGHDQCHWQQQKAISIGSDHDHQDFTADSLLDQRVPVELNKTERGGFGPLDWHATADQGLFDLPNTVDQAYWTTNTHWSDQDNPTLFDLP